MGTFAELNSNNVVIRLNKACNIDISNNGGDGSEQAAEYFKNNTTPLSSEGVKYVQTFFSGTKRKRVAKINGTYDPINDVFIDPKPYPSWVLNSNFDWESPIGSPSNLQYTSPDDNETYQFEAVIWDEEIKNWKGKELLESEPNWLWNSQTNTWVLNT